MAAGLALTAPLALKAAVGTLCGVRQKSPGILVILPLTLSLTLTPNLKCALFLRANSVTDAVDAAVNRKHRKAKK